MSQRLFIPLPAESKDHVAPTDTADWLPVCYDMADGQASVIWGNRPNLKAPFFPSRPWGGQRAQPVRYVRTDFHSVISRAAELPESDPAGIIFHVSRCGSTLVSNVMRCDPRAVVLSEAAPISCVLGDSLQNITQSGRR